MPTEVDVIVPTGTKSVIHNAGLQGFELVNDDVAPGNNKVYGTTSGGVRDWIDNLAVPLVTLSGVAAGETDLGTFTGGTIPNDSDIKEALQALETAVEAGSGGEIEYEATPVSGPDTGCFVRATVAGVTYSRTGGAGTNTEGILTIPDGAYCSQVFIHFDAAQAPGTTFYLNVDTLGTSKEVNGGQNSARPAFGTVSTKPATFSDGSPATSFVNSGTPLILGVAQMNDNGTRVRRRIKIDNYSQQAGSSASILALWL